MSKTGLWGDKIIVYLHSNDEKRDRHWCVNYRNHDNYCCERHGKCIGSSHCKYYEKKGKNVDGGNPAVVRFPDSNKPEDIVRKPGTVLHHKFKGDVVVVSSTPTDMVIKNIKGEQTKVQIKECIDRDLIKVIGYLQDK